MEQAMTTMSIRDASLFVEVEALMDFIPAGGSVPVAAAAAAR
jgi:hypothetical protein